MDFDFDFPVNDKEKTNQYLKHLYRWFNEGVEEAISRAGMVPDRWKLMLGCVVFGETFVRRFLDYCVPSLLAAGNILAIKDSPIWLVIQTDRASFSVMKADRGLIALSKLGICIELQEIPQPIVDGMPDDPMNKYWVIGAAHNLQMQQAKYMGYGYHMLMPDHVYSENYFKNLKRLADNTDAIVQGALSARIESASSELDHDGVLSVSAPELNAIALTHLHKQFHPYIMNGRNYEKDCPVHSFMFFVAKDAVHIMCPHMSPVYLSHAVLVKCPSRLFNTIDSQLPFFIPDYMRVTMPKPEDDMAYIEISDDTKPSDAPQPSNLEAFCIRFWLLTYCETGFLRYLDMDNVLPLPVGYRHSYTPMDLAKIEDIKVAVRAAVRVSLEPFKEEIDEKFHSDPLPQRAA